MISAGSCSQDRVNFPLKTLLVVDCIEEGVAEDEEDEEDGGGAAAEAIVTRLRVVTDRD